MDDDLESLSREQLIAEVRRLRSAIRVHRDSTGHDLCWHHPALWSLLPEKTEPLPVVPEWPQLMETRGWLMTFWLNRRQVRALAAWFRAPTSVFLS